MVNNQEKINEIVMEQLKNIQEEIKNLSVSLAKLPEQMAEKFDDRYASKRIELAVDRLGWLVIVAVVGGVLTMVLK